jgi:hypothetical protein
MYQFIDLLSVVIWPVTLLAISILIYKASGKA